MAAGSGSRFGHELPKQLLPLAGKPMIAWSIERLAGHSRIDSLVVVVSPGHEAGLTEVVSPIAAGKLHAVIPGGETRQDSVRLGLAAVPETATHVLVHDAARPCLTRALVDRMVDALGEHDAAVPVTPAVDTLVLTASGEVDAIVDRANIGRVQTPQAFRLALAREAHTAAAQRGLQSSDDGSLVMALGKPVAAIAGDRTNIKVTYQEDLVIAAAILGQE